MFSRFLIDESGATAAEYALILAVVGSGVAVALLMLGGTLASSLNRAANCISKATNAGC
jgi:pilus assembly protein Flp/PilA